MSILYLILYCIIFLAIFIGIIFLEKLLTNKYILLGLILPLLSLCKSIIIDIKIISTICNSCLGPRTIEQYKNGMLISKSTVVTSLTNIPTSIFMLVIINISTIVLFIVFFVDRKKIKCKKELAKMSINDLE